MAPPAWREEKEEKCHVFESSNSVLNMAPPDISQGTWGSQKAHTWSEHHYPILQMHNWNWGSCRINDLPGLPLMQLAVHSGNADKALLVLSKSEVWPSSSSFCKTYRVLDTLLGTRHRAVNQPNKIPALLLTLSWDIDRLFLCDLSNQVQLSRSIRTVKSWRDR